VREVTGREEELNEDDRTIRVEGNLTTVVGRHEAKRTFVVHAEGRSVLESSDSTEIASEKALVPRVGGSRLRLTGRDPCADGRDPRRAGLTRTTAFASHSPACSRTSSANANTSRRSRGGSASTR
jgi:hypothetical protein